MDNFNYGLMVGMTIALIVGATMAYIFTTPTSEWQSNAIERGYALYCPSTGDFAWKDECDVK